MTQALKAQPRCNNDLRQRKHFRKRCVPNRLIDADQRDGLAARFIAPKVEGGDVYAFIAEQRAKRADIAGYVVIFRVEQVRRELRIDAFY